MFAFGLLIAVCFVPGITGASIPTQWAVLSIILPLTLWRAAPFTALHFFGALFCGYACLSALWATNYHTSVLGLWLVFIWALSFRLGSSLPTLISLWKGLAIGLSISSAVAVAQALDYEPVITSPNMYAGLLYNLTVQGMSIALVLVALAAYRLWWYMPMLVLGLILSGSRGAFLVLATTAIARYIHWLAAIACLILGAAAFTYLLDPSDSQRLTIWGYALRGLSVFGWGPDSFSDVYYLTPGTELANIIHPEYTHNDYLQLWFEYGIGSLAIFILGAMALAQVTSREWPVAIACAIAGLFYFPLYCPITAFIAAVVAGNLSRDWALYGPLGHTRGPDLLSWNTPRGPIYDNPRSDIVSLVPRNSHSEV
jgi:hypothetical protein